MNPRKTILSLAASLLTLGACSSGGGSSDDPADITVARSLDGTWTATYTTGPDTTCPGEVIGNVDTGTIVIRQAPNSATVDIDVSQGGGTDSYTGRVASGVLELPYSFSDGSGVLRLIVQGGKLVGSDTFTFSSPSDCVLSLTIEAERVGGGPFAPTDLEGSYTFDVTVDESTNPQVPVGTQEPMAILFSATGSDSADATLLLGPYALAELSSEPGDITTFVGDVNGTALRVTLSRASSSEPFLARIEANEPGGDIVASATLNDALLCTPISGEWTFDFGGGNVITGTPMMQFCSLTLAGSTPNQRMAGIVDANGVWQGGVSFSQASGAEASFSGTFSGDTFTGTSNGQPVTGSRTTTSSNCTAVTQGTWNLVFSASGTPQLDPSGGSMTQNGCALTFNYVDSEFGLNLTLSGDVTGTAWTPSVSGPFAGTLTNVNLTFAANGNSLAGSAMFNGTALTVTGSKQ